MSTTNRRGDEKILDANLSQQHTPISFRTRSENATVARAPAEMALIQRFTFNVNKLNGTYILLFYRNDEESAAVGRVTRGDSL